MPEVTFQRYDAASARQIRDTVEAIYKGSYVEAMQAATHSTRSRRSWDGSTPTPPATASTWSSPTATASPSARRGAPLTQQGGARWWAGLPAEPEPGFTSEDGNRTFALSEIMVRQAHAGQGIAHALHDELLSKRTEQRATLLVEPDNTTAHRAYLRWGWRKVAQLRPG